MPLKPEREGPGQSAQFGPVPRRPRPIAPRQSSAPSQPSPAAGLTWSIAGASQRRGADAGQAVGADIASRRLLELIRHPERVAEFTSADTSSALCQVAAVLAALAAELARGSVDPRPAKAGDRLLTVEEVAQRLSMSPHAVYRRASGFLFTVHVGRYLRFSERGLEQYLESRRGR